VQGGYDEVSADVVKNNRGVARMQFSQLHYLPMPPAFFSFFLGLFVLICAAYVVLKILGVLQHAYEYLGVSSRTAMFLLASSLIGSAINIPVAELPHEAVEQTRVIEFLGMQYVVPSGQWQGTVIAVNVGGAVIPTLMSFYLLFKRELWVKGAVATAIVAAVLHWQAHPVPGLGIAVPIFLPVLITAAVAMLLSRDDAAPLAYIAGGLGTLIGADLTNLDKIPGLHAPVASIGGAGTFDGIFLTSILAVLLAHFYARLRHLQPG
jgi:uncharacterized membrane protein